MDDITAREQFRYLASPVGNREEFYRLFGVDDDSAYPRALGTCESHLQGLARAIDWALRTRDLSWLERVDQYYGIRETMDDLREAI